MTYTTPELLLMIAAIGAVIVNAITAWRNGTKIDDIGQKTAIIEGHVNSKETKYVEQAAAKDKEIEILRALLIDKDKTAALLAQAAIRPVTRASDQVEVKSARVLDDIEKNTKETSNTLKDLSEKQG